MELTKEQIRETIARRVAQELKEGDYVTLGIGLPTEVANYIPENVHVMIQSENGLIGVGKKPAPDKVDPKITNAGGIPVTTKQGAAFFDSQMSFAGLCRLTRKEILPTGWFPACLLRAWAAPWIWSSVPRK